MTRCTDVLPLTAGATASAAAIELAAKTIEGAHVAPPSPDAELLAVCARLHQMQAEWQRLYDATSDAAELTTPADYAWQAYSDHVWPGGVVADALPAQLTTLRATTWAGLQAKAAAILALDNAANYCDGRADHAELSRSLIEDVAGHT
jgi:hypothetical protein